MARARSYPYPTDEALIAACNEWLAMAKIHPALCEFNDDKGIPQGANALYLDVMLPSLDRIEQTTVTTIEAATAKASVFKAACRLDREWMHQERFLLSICNDLLAHPVQAIERPEQVREAA